MSILDPQQTPRLVTSQPDTWPNDPVSPVGRPSKTLRKSQLDAIKRFGEELVAMSPGRLARLELPDFLRKAIEEAQSTHAFGARKRQLQSIGRMMEDLDIEAIRADLVVVDRKHVPVAQTEALEPQTALVVDGLLSEGDTAVFALSERYDHDALSTLRQATRAARKKLATGADRTKTRRELADALARLTPR